MSPIVQDSHLEILDARESVNYFFNCPIKELKIHMHPRKLGTPYDF